MYIPALQGVHEVAPDWLVYEPLMQLKHMGVFSEPWYLPGEHEEHTDWPLLEPYVPLGHDLQSEFAVPPNMDWYLPDSQGRHQVSNLTPKKGW